MAAVTTPLRRKLALAAGLLCLGAPVLSSCGVDYATDRPNVIADGGYHIAGTGMRVLATRIVATGEGRGIFIATIAIPADEDPVTDGPNAPTLTGLSSSGDSDQQVTAKHFEPVAVGDDGAINLADPNIGGIPVTGDFSAGDFVPLTLTFSDGSTITLQTPVVTRCDEYAAVVPQGGASSSARASVNPTDSATSITEPSDSTSTSDACAYPSAFQSAE